MTLTDQQFSLLMLRYLEGTASRTERITLMNALAESDELCGIFNSIMALEKTASEATIPDEKEPLAMTDRQQN